MRTVDQRYLVDNENEMEEEIVHDIKYEEVYKEPSKLLKWMINSIIILMVAILITSILSTTSLHIIMANFNWFNIFTAEIHFRPKPPEEIGEALLPKINSPGFDLRLLPMAATKFVYENDRNINNEDLKFLLKMQVDKSKTLWKDITLSNYLLKYPEVSEAISIIWIIMTIIYQCGNRDSNWGIPQGWRIVVPSIFVFFVMALLTSIASVMGNKTIDSFCKELKKELIEPELVRCGLAISHLRLQRDTHEFIFDTILSLYHHMNYAKAFCWSFAFIVILLRFLFAIDFQLVELKMIRYDKPHIAAKSTDHFEPLPSDIEKIKESTLYETDDKANKLRRTKSKVTYSDEHSQHKKNYDDDDIEDFQSASSILMRTPLMGSGDYGDIPK